MTTLSTHLLGAVSFLTVLTCASAAAAFDITTGYPQRTNTARIAPPHNSYDSSATNAGINRADCLDDAQRFQFSFADVPADATTIEVWARGDGTSCSTEAERKSNCWRVAKWTVGSAYEIDNLSIVQAMEKKASVETKAAPADLCYRAAHMIATPVHLHVMAFSGDTVMNGADGKPLEIDYKTFYDIAGPNPPTGLKLGAGEGMLTAKFDAPSPNPSDFLKWKVYCVRGPAAVPVDAGSTDSGSADSGSADSGSDSSSTDSGSTDSAIDDTGSTDSASDDSGSTDSGSTDSGADTAVDAGAAADAGDAGKSNATASCPANPFQPGKFPTSELDKYLCGEGNTVAGEIVITGRENELPYAVALVGIDKQGNVGVVSNVACETPRATNSFWDEYNAAGGLAGGGYCTYGHGSADWGLIALGGLALGAFVLRRKKAGGLFLGLALLALPATSHAAESVVAVEARFGPYRPQVDKAFDGKEPYNKSFGDGIRVMAGAEIDLIPFHIKNVGSIAFGGLFGYTYASAKADFADGTGASAEKTRFDLWVFSALTTLRVDAVARNTKIPLVPYGKLGLATSLWSSSDGNGVSKSADGRVARGHTNGFFYALGAMVLLDALDPEAAKLFAAERGVQHSYLFGELTVADLRGFGQTNVLRTSDLTWTAGLAFEM